MPFFSIIVPTYNRSNLIAKTIQSVINQVFNDWELIIVDDGGEDNTEGIVKGFNDKRIKYFWKENEERGIARNYGTQKSNGDYVFFLDSDDIIYPHHLQHAYIELKKLKSPEFFHSRYEEVFPNKIVQVEKLNKQTIWKKIQKQNKFACQFFLRKDVALQFPFLKNRQLKIGEDWLVVLKVGSKFTLHFSNQVNGSITQHSKRSMCVVKCVDVLKSRDIIISELGEIKNSSKIINNVYYELTSLASLSAVLEKKKRIAIQVGVKLFLKYPIQMLKQRRTLAIIKHLFK